MNIDSQMQSQTPNALDTDASSDSRFPNLRFWSRALAFHAHHWYDLVPALPVLFLPVVSDALYASLIRQHLLYKGKLQLSPALKEAFASFPNLLAMKVYFWLAAILWGYLPGYGWMRDYLHRINWAMSSNVLHFEGLYGPIGRKRCMSLAQQTASHSAIRVLVTIPTLLIFACFFVIGVTTFVLESTIFFWISGFVILWILIPGSAAVNTFYYLSIPSVASQIPTSPTLQLVRKHHSDFCPRCLHYEHLQARCLRFQIAVDKYPKQFGTHCNAEYFESTRKLPDQLVCPQCSAILDLDENERDTLVFSCPACNALTDWSPKHFSSDALKRKTTNA
jgi:hypothetical protein